MFQRILVPLDFTAANRRALEAAAELARGRDARIMLLHVIETISGISFEELRPFYESLEKRALSRLEEAAGPLRDQGIPVETAVLYGNRPREIVRHATANQADLIVLSSHKPDPEAPGRTWGSVSYKVGLLAMCSVLLVK